MKKFKTPNEISKETGYPYPLISSSFHTPERGKLRLTKSGKLISGEKIKFVRMFKEEHFDVPLVEISGKKYIITSDALIISNPELFKKVYR